MLIGALVAEWYEWHLWCIEIVSVLEWVVIDVWRTDIDAVQKRNLGVCLATVACRFLNEAVMLIILYVIEKSILV